MKPTFNRAINHFRYPIITVLIVSFSLLAIISFVINLMITDEISDRLQEESELKIRDIIVEEVNNRYNDITFALNEIEDQEKRLIKAKIDVLASSFGQIEEIEVMTLIERRESFRQMLAAIDEDDREYLYFAIAPDGTLFQSGTDPKFNGTYMMDHTDKDGVRFVEEGLKAIDNEEGVYVTYHWPKVKDGEPLRKTSFFKYIPEAELVVGTGNYDEDVEKALRERTFDSIRSYYNNLGHYIFLVDYDGTIIVHPDPEVEGTDFRDIIGSNGISAHDEAMNLIRDKGVGIIHYDFSKINTGRVLPKTTYVKNIERWNVYMGMGYYNDEVESVVSDGVSYFYRMQLVLMGIIIILITITSIIVFGLIRRAMMIHREQLAEEELVFLKLFQQSSEGIMIVGQSCKVLYMNSRAFNLFGKNPKQYFIDCNTMNVDAVEDDIFKLRTPDDRTEYISYTTKKFSYLGQKSVIYFIRYMTKYYLDKMDLQEHAFNDPLTGAANRRKLEEDMEQILQMEAVERVLVSVIDIDDFKFVNDTYGHEVGDRILKTVVQIFDERLRDPDRIYRYGGDEFVVIVHGVEIKKASTILKDIASRFRNEVKEMINEEVTLSIGLKAIDSDMKNLSWEQVIASADELLYEAKNEGKNRLKS